MSSETIEYLKIQKGGVYIEIAQDENQLENTRLAIDLLTWFIKRLETK